MKIKLFLKCFILYFMENNGFKLLLLEAFAPIAIKKQPKLKYFFKLTHQQLWFINIPFILRGVPAYGATAGSVLTPFLFYFSDGFKCVIYENNFYATSFVYSFMFFVFISYLVRT